LCISQVDDPIQLEVPQLTCALLLSTVWQFDAVRDWTIAKLDKVLQDPMVRIELALSCSIPKWLLPAYIGLCTQDEHLSWGEVERIGFRTYHIVSRAREHHRTRIAALRSTSGGIADPIPPPTFTDPPSSPERSNAEVESGLMNLLEKELAEQLLDRDGT